MRSRSSFSLLSRSLSSSNLRRFLAVATVGVAPALFAACAGAPAEPSPDNTGEVTLALALVPADVACVRVTAAGVERTVVRLIDVEAGSSLSQTMAGLPLGPVVFTGEAFSAVCDDVTASTVPGWVSDPQSVSVVLARSASVELTMHRNGRAKVTVGFADEPACSPATAACQASSECCSHTCSHGQCTGTNDAGGDAVTNDAGH